jgi:hypothetical protein
VRQLESIRISPFLLDLSRSEGEMKNLVHVSFGDQQLFVLYEKPKGIPKARPLGKKDSCRIENLHAIIAAIGNVEAILSIDRKSVRRAEFARGFAFLTPLADELSAPVQPDNAAIPGVRNVNIAF